ncbi:type I-E CRISPR-associated protein Cas6/Cse3/CasE [Bosea sp. RAC05]|uniref:type I-E CRISPR-associated protein Cas6/Cse3/CasE n=1 Tax=Bosea sp. RAC05 TaxID=1842539 RepID=UPI00083D963A|nr:type I-E CRISPR-associated protein Cas6/Cse3/CasE [Bosea sp. RAC05]AOG03112.1 CRISPR associated family protein [Bosea sp. RAC05]
MLHMIRLNPDVRQAAVWGAANNLLRTADDQGYLWHSLLAAAFGAAAPKPWRLVEPDGRAPYLVGYTAADKAELVDASQFADPLVSAALGLDELAVKRMPVEYRAGQRFGFQIRVRPTVRSSIVLDGEGQMVKRGDRGQRIEIDVLQHAMLVAREQGTGSDIPPETVYGQWLRDRLSDLGADHEPEALKLTSRRRSAIVRRDQSRTLRVHGQSGGGPDVGIAGVIKVVDPAAFPSVLARGVGRHRSFGFGMMLLEPLR